MSDRIKFDGTGGGDIDYGVHFVPPFGSDFTLCGLTLDLDPKTAGGYNMTKEPVDCKDCIEIVTFCKSIKKNEYKQKNANPLF